MKLLCNILWLFLALVGSAQATSFSPEWYLSQFAQGLANGTYTFTPSGGLQLGSPSGGDKGVGALNATAVYINGVPVPTSLLGPGGASCNLQYNAAGAFGGTTDLCWSAAGLVAGGAVGGGEGVGTLNATNLFVNGQQVPVTGAEIAALLTGNEVATLLNTVTAVAPTFDRIRTAAEIAAGVTPTNYAYPPYTMLRYGADPTGATDSTAALQAAITAAQQAGYSMVTVGTPGATFKIGSTWSINTNVTGLDCQGAIFNAAGFSGGDWLQPIQSVSDVNLRPTLNAAHPIKNCTFQGPGAQISGNVAIFLNDSVNNNIAGLKFQNIGLPDWDTALYFGIGSFMTTCDTCFITTSSVSTGVNAHYSVVQSNSANSGERNTLINSTVSNNGWGIENLNGNGTLDLINDSIDYIENKALYAAAGRISMIGGHVESSYDLDNWIYATGVNSSILLSGLDISIAANKPNFSVCYSDSSVVAGGVKFQDVFLRSSFSFGNQPLCAGTGIFAIRGLQEFQTGQRLPISAYANQFAYGSFENANYAADWTFGGTTPPARSSAQNHTPSGTYSLAFAGTSSNTPTASRTLPAKPGSIAHGEVWNIAPGFASGTFFGSWEWVDAGGNSLSNGTIFSVTSTLAAWTLTQFNTTVAPPGTAGFALLFDVFGVSSGTQTGYVDDVMGTVVEP